MKFILASLVLGGLAFLLHKSIRKYAPLYYIGAIAISCLTAARLDIMSVNLIAREFSLFFERGIVATALFNIVMWTAIFKNGTQLKIRFMSIRGELSIIACILTLAHNFFYGRTYIIALFTRPEVLTANPTFLAATLLTLVLLAMMLPLMITSFKAVRKKMKASNWKKLQRWAYPFYMLIYIHVMILFVPIAMRGNKGYWLDIGLYTAVFLSYAVLRLKKAYATKKNKKGVK